MPARDPFTVLADPTRRRILDLLREQDLMVSELVDLLRTAQPNVSKHLKVLDEAHLVNARVDGPRRHYALVSEPLRELDQWLEPYRRTWAGRLDALEAHLDEMTDDEGES
ncbi:winged helix-turn-helix transcriptional regulator [Ruania alkalisoli]|uniref:Winged helix-turn-helix transcriptional regulator n=1 Tax=Ruania alkalisoli TaxID=2779775 RepID=A0A7M1SZ79_9MICO|nr:metalloregulator ArsR/SmtB family transcription factor [Ruania alkalisoli]QOR71943.1 winged helix-turn-helix transcriptional regulator [Ruania alkalisoli]